MSRQGDSRTPCRADDRSGPSDPRDGVRQIPELIEPEGVHPLTEEERQRWIDTAVQCLSISKDRPGRSIFESTVERALLDYEATVREVEGQLATARATNQRLNRRAQMAESAVAEKIDANKIGGFGKQLLRMAYRLVERERDEARAEVERLRDALDAATRLLRTADGDIARLSAVPLEEWHSGNAELLAVRTTARRAFLDQQETGGGVA